MFKELVLWGKLLGLALFVRYQTLKALACFACFLQLIGVPGQVRLGRQMVTASFEDPCSCRGLSRL